MRKSSQKRSVSRHFISKNRFVAVVLAVIFSIIILSNYEMLKIRITSWGTQPSLNVSISTVTDGKILLVFEPMLEYGENQNIFVEFINTGTESYTAKIEEHIYYINETKMDLLVSYYDSLVDLYAGERRGFSTIFRPPYPGGYYIKVKVPYDYKVAQTWGTFLVWTYVPVTTTVTAAPTPAPPAPPPVLPGPADVLMECPNNVTLIQGSSQIFGLTITNVGERTLNNLKFYTSAPYVLDVDITPKTRAKLDLNASSLFLITVSVPTDAAEGTYPLEIGLTTDELRAYKTVDVMVVSSNISKIEYLEVLFSNYKYLIDKVESEIYAAALEGYDVGYANESIKMAKLSLESARTYFEAQDFDNTMRELRNVVKYLEDALLQLASAMMYVYKPPVYYPFLLIVVEILLAIGIFIIFYLNRRRERRPKALEAAAETGGVT